MFSWNVQNIITTAETINYDNTLNYFRSRRLHNIPVMLPRSVM